MTTKGDERARAGYHGEACGYRERLCDRAAIVTGLILGGLTTAWGLHLSWHLAFSGGLVDFAIGSYICLALLRFQRRPKLGVIFVPLVLIAAQLGAIAKYAILQSDVEATDVLLIDDLVVHYLIQRDWRPMLVVALAGLVAGILVFNLRIPRLAECKIVFPMAVFGVALGGMTQGALAPLVLPVISNTQVKYPTAVLLGQWGTFLKSALALASRQEQFRELASRARPDFGFIATTLKPTRQRNVHILIMESLIDPATISGIALSPDPFAPLFQDWRRDNGPRSMQPVFGGRSPDGEFEVLCGLPATLDGDRVVFTQLADEAIDCLPNKLRRLGYLTETWVPVLPSEFSYESAYRRLGFTTRRFADDVDISDRDGENVSADSLLQQNLAHIRGVLAAGTPILNYIFVTAGHFPYELDQSKRPRRVSVEPESEIVSAYVNCGYYTTRAVQAYIEELRRIDPTAIIVALGDHPPSLPDVPTGVVYPRDMDTRFDVPLLVFDGERGLLPMHGQFAGYSIPSLIADLLSGGRFCDENRCTHRERMVVRPLQRGLLVVDRQTGAATDCADDPSGQVCADARKFADGARLAVFNLVGMR